jgi:hypothetical protein
MVGLSWLALALVALATERWRMAGFLVGLAPAFHASLGAWLGIAIAALPALRPHLRALCTGVAFEAALCALSLGVHLALAPALPPCDPASAKRYLALIRQ